MPGCPVFDLVHLMAGSMTVMAWAICGGRRGRAVFRSRRCAAVQQQEASAAPATRVAGWRLLVHLVRRPRWVLGMVAMLLGAGLHLLALRSVPLVLVQPLGVSAVLFALPLAAALRGYRVRAGERAAGALVPNCRAWRPWRHWPAASRSWPPTRWLCHIWSIPASTATSTSPATWINSRTISAPCWAHGHCARPGPGRLAHGRRARHPRVPSAVRNPLHPGPQSATDHVSTGAFSRRQRELSRRLLPAHPGAATSASLR
jgi:hypothetical protein